VPSRTQSTQRRRSAAREGKPTRPGGAAHTWRCANAAPHRAARSTRSTHLGIRRPHSVHAAVPLMAVNHQVPVLLKRERLLLIRSRALLRRVGRPPRLVMKPLVDHDVAISLEHEVARTPRRPRAPRRWTPLAPTRGIRKLAWWNHIQLSLHTTMSCPRTAPCVLKARSGVLSRRRAAIVLRVATSTSTARPPGIPP